MLFFYIRHGDPCYDPDSLTPLGLRQAEAVGRRLALHGLDRIYSSTSIRARQTAQPACEMLHLEPILLDFAHENHAWAEFSFDFDGKGVLRDWPFRYPSQRRLFTRPELRNMGKKWYDHPSLRKYKMEKGMERLEREIYGLFRELGYDKQEGGYYNVLRDNQERVALFAHQGFGLLFLSVVLDIPYAVLSMHFDMFHSGFTAIEFANEDGIAIPRVVTFSNDSHLYEERLPTRFANNETMYKL